MVAAGRDGDFIARNEKLTDVLKSQPGFQGYFLLNSLGYLHNYVRLILWESREVQQAALQSPAYLSFTQANPPGELDTESAPDRDYEVVLEIAGPGQPGVVNLNDFIVDVEGAVPAFVESRKVYWGAAKENDPRFVRRLLLRQLGSVNIFVGFTLHTEFAPTDDARSWGPPARDNFTTLPFTAERYEIVLQV
jgi:heme-degrading monooxygenase HmoA